MTRRRYVQINGELVEYGDHVADRVAPMVMPDIGEYRSMVDGSIISSRSKHREHLHRHGMEEIGNETKHMLKPYEGIPDCNPAGRKELIRAQIDAMSHAEFKRAIRRDVERVKWQSRED